MRASLSLPSPRPPSPIARAWGLRVVPLSPPVLTTTRLNCRCCGEEDTVPETTAINQHFVASGYWRTFSQVCPNAAGTCSAASASARQLEEAGSTVTEQVDALMADLEQ